jgi:hypothetical protein
VGHRTHCGEEIINYYAIYFKIGPGIGRTFLEKAVLRIIAEATYIPRMPPIKRKVPAIGAKLREINKGI